MTDVQEELGKLNDVVVSETLVRRDGFHTDAQEPITPVVDWLDGRKRRHMRTVRRMLCKFR
ncbi:hypothetical protein YK56LOC_32100 [Caballeronia sp. HLA56]